MAAKSPKVWRFINAMEAIQGYTAQGQSHGNSGHDSELCFTYFALTSSLVGLCSWQYKDRSNVLYLFQTIKACVIPVYILII